MSVRTWRSRKRAQRKRKHPPNRCEVEKSPGRLLNFLKNSQALRSGQRFLFSLHRVNRSELSSNKRSKEKRVSSYDKVSVVVWTIFATPDQLKNRFILSCPAGVPKGPPNWGLIEKFTFALWFNLPACRNGNNKIRIIRCSVYCVFRTYVIAAVVNWSQWGIFSLGRNIAYIT